MNQTPNPEHPLTEQEALEIINRIGMAATFLSCADLMLDALFIFKKDLETRGNMSFYAKGLKAEAEKAIKHYFKNIDEGAERRTYQYKDLQEQHQTAFIGCAAFPDLHDAYLNHLKAFNEKYGFVGVEDREFLEMYHPKES